MCLSVAAKVVSIDGQMGIVDVGGIRKNVGFQLVPDVKVGDYVLLHAGFAIQIIDEEDARETIALLNELFEAGETT